MIKKIKSRFWKVLKRLVLYITMLVTNGHLYSMKQMVIYIVEKIYDSSSPNCHLYWTKFRFFFSKQGKFVNKLFWRTLKGLKVLCSSLKTAFNNSPCLDLYHMMLVVETPKFFIASVSSFATTTVLLWLWTSQSSSWLRCCLLMLNFIGLLILALLTWSSACDN